MPTIVPPLDPETHAELVARFNDAPDPETRTRYQMVLLSTDKHLTTRQIASVTFRSHDTALRVINRFLADGLDGVPHRLPPGRAPKVTPEWLAELQRVIELDPHTVAVNSANWTTQLLADYLKQQTGIDTDQETVRDYLHRLDYVYKRPNWTVQHKAQEREGYLGNA